MSLGLVNRKEKQKQRNRQAWALIKFIFLVSFFGGTGYYAYEAGVSVAKDEALRWKAQHDTQITENERLKIELGKDKATLDQLSQLMPNQKIRNLLVAVTERANSGVDISRMETVIRGLSKDAQCSNETDTKRFIVLTSVSTQDISTASFYRGLITLSGHGSPTTNEDGNPEAWFDTAKEVTISFMLPGGEQQDINGPLPLYHSVIASGSEYRFSITSGRVSFADVSVQKCAL